MKINECPISGDTNSFKFLNLGNIPIEGNLETTRIKSISAKKYPMYLQYFSKSKLVTLTEYVNPDDIYLNYLYHSSISKPYLDHCTRMYDYITKFVSINDRDQIIDIGGNDGSLLIQFKNKNLSLSLTNVECSKSFSDINAKKGITYVNDYFGENINLPKKAKVITSTNVFQHTAPLRSFVKGIYNNLLDEGIWCLEFPYFMNTFINDNYDQAYHEHVYYYLLTPLVQLFKQEGLKIVDVSFHNIHTGTLRILSTKSNSKITSNDTVFSFLNLENVINEEYCIEWGNKIMQKITNFKSFFNDLKEKGNTIYGFGAAIKGCVFLNTCNLDYNTIDYIIDDTPQKQTLYVPGTGIEVVSRKFLQYNSPDYILILSHNFKDYIINSLRQEYNGKFLVMFPNIQIIR